MKVLRSWLNDYTKIEIGNEELAEKLNAKSGTEVEAVLTSFDDNVVVAEILAIKSHPNADRLRIATVNTGKEKLDIVCGAPNIEVGQKVPLALVGARLGEEKLNKAVIRGVESNGMLCAEDELGLGKDHSGIKILDQSCEVGRPLSDYIVPESVFDLEITPNRSDQLSHIGMAREISAILSSSFIQPDTINLDTNQLPKLEIILEDKEDCHQYYGLKISGIKIDQSPDWLKQRLLACGLRPINNVVDVTNYVMLDLGQPLHAFDASKVGGDTIVVRLAGDGETIKALDGQERKLSDSMLVIADKEKPIAIAGVIGGVNSEVAEGTSEIILEAAEFNPQSVRRTAKSLAITTDASYRFERGIDGDGIEYALKKAAKLILELAGGKISSGITYIGTKPETVEIDIEHARINRILGLSLSSEEINNYLKALLFKVKENKCIVPSWRHDISIWQDLAEEVGRLYGLDKIPHFNVEEAAITRLDDYHKKEFLKDILVELGFNEVINYPFLSQADLEVVGIESNDLLEVANPAQTENKYLRRSLVPGLLKSIAKNPTFDPVAIFTFGNTFSEKEETTNLAIAVSGKDARKIAQKAVEALSKITNQNGELFSLREMSRDELAKYKIRKPVTYVMEVKVEDIIQSMNISNDDLSLKETVKDTTYRPISKYPSVVRDIAFIVDAGVSADEISSKIYSCSGLINRVELFDEFVSDKFGHNKKNLAFHLDLQHQDRTLTDQEAEEIIKLTIEKIEKDFGAEVR